MILEKNAFAWRYVTIDYLAFINELNWLKDRYSLQGHFLKTERVLLCLFQNLGDTCPQCPWLLRLSLFCNYLMNVSGRSFTSGKRVTK